jgi:dihydroneopterin aldolase
MTRTINVEGIKLYAYHGCLPEETKIGGEYIVNVNMEYDFSESAKTDDLTQTIDYCTVFEICKKEMAVPSKLIEHVCQRIYNNVITTFPNLIKTKVTIIKLLPPMNGPVDKVSVSIEG